ncbi:MAG: recombinase family protein [Desulfamplus sp.]|nr:recombinase family protein [Desulfamplus sp.]
MTTWGYVRVSTDEQSIENQKLTILEYANKNKMTVDKWIEITISSRRSSKERMIDELLQELQADDTLIVAELSRLGRSVGQITIIVNELVKKKIKLICLKENIHLNAKATIQNKVTITMFSLFAEIERDLISERTKEGLARVKAEGKNLGRPKGTLGKSKLDGKQKEIQTYLQKRVNKTSIARIFDVSRPALVNFIETRGLSDKKSIKVELWLRVENNSKFVRGKSKVRKHIEDFILSEYDMKKPDKDGWEYELTIPYENDKDLDDKINSMLQEMDSEADMRNCFIEADVTAMDGSDRSW